MERVIAYYNQAMNWPEQSYCITHKDLLAMLSGMTHFHPYLYGWKFLVRTDHSSLHWLLRFKEPDAQIARLLEKLQQYDVNVAHMAEKLMGMPTHSLGALVWGKTVSFAWGMRTETDATEEK